jgi:gliding motility-associated-like protein
MNLYVPNAFTIGGGLNDLFMVRAANIGAFDLSIYDRWGQKIFHTTDIHQGWDGTHRGQFVPPDVYVWQINYQDGVGQAYTKKGNVTLLR